MATKRKRTAHESSADDTKASAAADDAPTTTAAPAARASKRSKAKIADDQAAPAAPAAPAKTRRGAKAKSTPGDGAAAAKRSSTRAAAKTNGTAVPAKLHVPPDGGELLVFGNGECGQLGLGEKFFQRKKPAQVKLLKDNGTESEAAVAVACGAMHNVVVTTQGDVFTFGCNDEGALGRKAKEDQGEEFPGLVPGLLGLKVVQVSAGDSHSCALTDEGRVYLWGTYRNKEGLLGFSSGVLKQSNPALVTALSNHFVVQISSGENHTLALTRDGDVFEWGDVRINRRRLERLKLQTLQPRLVTVRGRRSSERPVAIFSGGYHCFYLTDNDMVFAWGLNNYGQCGTGDLQDLVVPTHIPALSNKKAKQIDGGEHHTLMLTHDGVVYALGRGDYGQLGQGNNQSSSTPVQVTNFKLNFDQEGAGDRRGQDASDEKIEIVSIACGMHHCLAITRTGYLFTWGFGERLQLGNGEEHDERSPFHVLGRQLENKAVIGAACGSQHTAIIARSNKHGAGTSSE